MNNFVEKMGKETFIYEGSDLEAMAFAPKYHQWILSDFSPYLGEKILEVGAGRGEISKVMAPKASRYVLVEPDPQNFAALQDCKTLSAPNIQMFQGFGEEYYASHQETFDSILYVNVLEHIEDDAREVHLAYQALRPGGFLCIFVPALPCLFGAVDKAVGHYRRYTRPSLKNCFLPHEFEIIRCRYFDVAGVLPWYLSTCLLGNTTPNSSMVKIYDNYFVPVMKRIESLPPLLGKNLLLVAQKK